MPAKRTIAALARKPAVHLALIALLGFLVYANTFDAPFIWDDIRLIQNNPFIKDTRFPVESLNTLNAPDARRTNAAGRLARGDAGSSDRRTALFDNEELYKTIKQRYVGIMTFVLNHRLDGFRPAGYHIVNLAIHLLNGLLLYCLVLQSFRTPFLRRAAIADQGPLVALVCSLLFIAHPVQTNAVTYVYQRFTALATSFTLLAFLLYIRYRLSAPAGEETGSATGSQAAQSTPAGLAARSLAWYAGVLAALLLGMKTKENAVLAPFAIALYDLSFFTDTARRRVVRLAPLLLMAGIVPFTYLVGMGRSVSQVIRAFDVMHYDRVEYLFTQFSVVASYLRLLFWPDTLVLDYDYPLYTTFWTPPVYLSFSVHAALAGLAAYLFMRSRSQDPELRLVAFGIMWFYLFHAMESSVVTFSQLYLEYRNYLPSAGLFLAVAAGGGVVLSKFPSARVAVPAAFAVGTAVLALSAATYARNAVWSDETALWEDNIRKSPTRFVPYYNLGLLYARQGRFAEAADAYRMALQLEPRYPETYVGLASVYRRQGRPAEAVQMLTDALMIDPGHLPARRSLGILYDDLGRHADAVREFREVLRREPGDAKARTDLGIAYLRMGNADAALREMTHAASLDPRNVEARKTLGMAYAELGRIDDAIRELDAALALDPARTDVRTELSIVLSRRTQQKMTGR